MKHIKIILTLLVIIHQLSAQTICNNDTVYAGPDITVCGSNQLQLQGYLSDSLRTKGAIWQGGSGTFYPNNKTLNATYIPEAFEIEQGELWLELLYNESSSNMLDKGLFSYDHNGKDSFIYINPTDGAVTGLINNNGNDFVAMGYDAETNKIYAFNAIASSSKGFWIMDLNYNYSYLVKSYSNIVIWGCDYDNTHKILYAVGMSSSANNSPQTLYRVNVTTGDLIPIGNLLLPGTTTLFQPTGTGINGLAYDSEKNVCYGATANNQLYSINVTTGLATLIGNININPNNSITGLAYDFYRNILYGIDQLSNVYIINKNTGSIIKTIPRKGTFTRITSLTYIFNNPYSSFTCRDSVKISFNNLKASFSDSTMINCYDDCTGSATITPTGGVSPYTYSWNNSKGNNASATNLCAEVVYEVTVTDNSGCTVTKSISLTENSEIIVSIDSIISSTCLGNTDGATTISATGGISPYSYLWNNSVTTQQNINIMGGTYTVTVTDSVNCSKTFKVDIGYTICDIEIPNVFSPNNDGINDYFVIKNIEVFKGNVLTIYNRWGNKVTEFINYDNKWFGTGSDGHKLSDGVYFYVLKLSDEKYYKGTVTIVR